MDILERKQIQKYLEDKQLPLDIYLEIEDHIISQIEELEHEGIGFQEAFLQVKTKWKKELSFQNFSFSDVKAVPKIVAKIRSTYMRELIPRIFIISFSVLLMFILGAYQLDKRNFDIFYTIVFTGFICIPTVIHIVNYKILIMRTNHRGKPLNAFDVIVDSCYGLSILPLATMMNTSKNAEMFYNVFYISETSLLSKILILSMPLYFSSVCLFAAFIFIKYKREVAKMKLS